MPPEDARATATFRPRRMRQPADSAPVKPAPARQQKKCSRRKITTRGREFLPIRWPEQGMLSPVAPDVFMDGQRYRRLPPPRRSRWDTMRPSTLPSNTSPAAIPRPPNMPGAAGDGAAHKPGPSRGRKGGLIHAPATIVTGRTRPSAFCSGTDSPGSGCTSARIAARPAAVTDMKAARNGTLAGCANTLFTIVFLTPV